MGRLWNSIGWRLGNTTATGTRAVNRHAVKLVSKCPGRMLVGGTTAGDVHNFNIGNYNDPMGLLSGFTGDDDWHPEHHKDLIALGYDKGVVKQANYRFDIDFRGTNSADKDFIFMWWFTRDSDSVTLTAGSLQLIFFNKPVLLLVLIGVVLVVLRVAVVLIPLLDLLILTYRLLSNL